MGQHAKGQRNEIAPFVLVVDRSGSMESAVDALNAWVPSFVATLRDIPETRDNVALGVVAFNERAQAVRRITRLKDDATTPHFKAEGRTSYAKPLDELRRLLEQDLPQLAERGRRPVALFLTDGHPNAEEPSEWLASRERLLAADFPLRPTLATLGFGSVDAATLKRVASQPELAEVDSDDPHTAIHQVLDLMTNTVLTLTTHHQSAVRDDRLADRILADEADQTIAYR